MNQMNRSRLTKFGRLCCAAIFAWSIIGCDKDPVSPEGPGTPTPPVFNAHLYDLRLTEIHYNPSDLDEVFKSDSLEFIEMKNTGTTTINLGGLVFSDGIEFTFPESTMLAPNAYLVLASSNSGFTKRYSKAPDGVYKGNLKNSGETIKLINVVSDSTIFSQFYTDSLHWAKEADGDGYSLVTVDSVPARGATVLASAWHKSQRLHGSPWAADISFPVNTALFNLRITEIHYKPADFNGTDGDSIEFIELKNVGSVELPLGGIEFINGITYAFPSNAKIAAGAYLVLASDSATFKRRYPDITPFGSYTDHLSNAGEKVVLADTVADTVLISINFKDDSPWPKIDSSEGYSLVTSLKNPGANQNDPSTWRHSFLMGGSPGIADPGVVVINEIITHTDLTDTDAVELFNPSEDPVDISGWYLSNDQMNPIKFKIPVGSVIAPGGYLFFTGAQFTTGTSPTSFALDSHGGEVVLAADQRGCAYGYYNVFKYKENEKGISIGRQITSTGKEVFVAQKSKTFGAINTGAMYGPIVISEIMYHSLRDTDDYVEITNITDQDVPLFLKDHPDTTWKLSGAGFSFPESTVIKANESVIIAMDSMAPAVLRGMYTTIAAEVRIFTNAGGLKNNSEKLELLKPEAPFVKNPAEPNISVYPYMLMDEVDYSDGSNWPDADGNGLSLHRKAGSYGDDPKSWESKLPTPGKL